MLAAAVAAMLWLGFFAYRDTAYTDELWWTFLVDKQASGFLRADGNHGNADVPFETMLRHLDHMIGRLGEEGVILTLPEGTMGPFGEAITRIALPAHWSRGLTGDEIPVIESQKNINGISILYGRFAMSYSAAGLVRT